MKLSLALALAAFLGFGAVSTAFAQDCHGRHHQLERPVHPQQQLLSPISEDRSEVGSPE